MAADKNNKAGDDFPHCLDMSALPPNHNRFIGAVPAITLDNVLGVLGIVQRLLGDKPSFELNLSEEETAGLYCIIENTREALRFESYYRRRSEPDPGDDSPVADKNRRAGAGRAAAEHGRTPQTNS